MKGCAEGGIGGCWCVMRCIKQDNDLCHPVPDTGDAQAQKLCLTLIICLVLKAQRGKKN